MINFAHHRITSVALAALLGLAMAAPALARDPVDTNGYAGTGIAVVPLGDNSGNGLTPAEVAGKVADYDLFLRGAKTRVVASKSVAGAEPAAIAAAAGNTLDLVVMPYVGYHQKTNYYCLVAVVQSIAARDLGTSYEKMGTTSIRGGQDKIYGTNLSNGIRAYYPDDISKGHVGASDPKGLAWINTQFKNKGYGFSYLGNRPTSVSDFMGRLTYDNYFSDEMTYVRVDLTVGYRGWKQAKNADGSHPEHATMAAGYDNGAKTVASFDPFSWSASGKCQTGYSSSPDRGCKWTITQSSYYTSMDKYVTSELPVWY
jgi:hypothetical protein